MHVAKVSRPYKDREYTYWFVRQTYREDGKVKHRTLANLSALPPEVIELVARALKGERFTPAGAALRTVRTLPHGHVAAVLGLARSVGLPGLLDRRPSRQRDLAIALVAARVLAPASKLATAGWLADTTLAGPPGCRGRRRERAVRARWTGCSPARRRSRPPSPTEPRARRPGSV